MWGTREEESTATEDGCPESLRAELLSAPFGALQGKGVGDREIGGPKLCPQATCLAGLCLLTCLPDAHLLASDQGAWSTSVRHGLVKQTTVVGP